MPIPIQVELLNKLQFLTAKTQVVLINCTEKIYITKRSGSLLKIKEYIDTEMKGARAIPFSVAWEQKYYDADEEGKAAIVEQDGVQSAFPAIIKTGYAALRLQYFFTVGHDEVGMSLERNGIGMTSVKTGDWRMGGIGSAGRLETGGWGVVDGGWWGIGSVGIRCRAWLCVLVCIGWVVVQS